MTLRLLPIVLLALTACNRSEPAAGSAAPDQKIAVVSKGAAFAAKDYVVPGKVSILELTADW